MLRTDDKRTDGVVQKVCKGVRVKMPTKNATKRPGKRKETPKLRCVDLFCGCGGMSLGFAKAGFDVKAGFELWEPAINVYKANFNN